MLIIKTSDYEYVGFNNKLHTFRSLWRKEVISVANAKIVDTASDVVLFCKPDGTVEPSYATLKKVSPNIVKNVLAKVL